MIDAPPRPGIYGGRGVGGDERLPGGRFIFGLARARRGRKRRGRAANDRRACAPYRAGLFPAGRPIAGREKLFRGLGEESLIVTCCFGLGSLLLDCCCFWCWRGDLVYICVNEKIGILGWIRCVS